MKTRTLVRADKILGPPFCVALFFWEKGMSLFRRLLPQRPPPPVRRVLLIKCFGMGSIVNTTPAISALKKAHPGSRVVLYTFAANRELCRLVPEIDDVIGIDASNPWRLASSAIVSLFRIRRERFDTVLNLEFYARYTVVLSYLSGAARRIGFFYPAFWFESLCTSSVPYNTRRHIREIYGHLLRPIGIAVEDLSLRRLEAGPAAGSAVDKLLAGAGGPPRPWIAVNVNVSELSYERRWPAERFRDLLVGLSAARGGTFFLVGGGGDRAYVAAFREGLPAGPRVVDLSGRLSIEELVALFRRADLVISNDSGPLQIAIAAGARTLSLFGPETPDLYGPLEPGHRVLYRGIFCSPCLNTYSAKIAACNGNNVCMKEILPSEALRTALQMLDERR